MANGRYILSDPSGTSGIPYLEIKTFPADLNGTFRSTLDRLSLAEFTQSRYPVFNGPTSDRYLWNLPAVFTESERLHFEALVKWQQKQIRVHAAWQDGGRVGAEPAWRLEWIDEMELVEPEPTVSRTLVQSLSTSFGFEYGYPVVDCAIALPDNHATYRGVRIATGEPEWLVQFTVIELPA